MAAETEVADPDVVQQEATEPPAATLDLAAVAAGGHIIVNGPDGQPVAAVVPLSVLQELTELRELKEDLEDSILILEARLKRALTGEELIPWEQIKAEHGL